MLMKTDVLCGFWKEGEPAHEFWAYVSDSEDDSDYDSDINRGERGFQFRVVNASEYDSDTSNDGDDGALTIYPGPDHQHSRYRHAHLHDFSQTAIKKYNQDTGNKYEFVELVNASVVTTPEAAFIVVIFKACQSGDTMVATSFRAEARSASKTLTGSYDIETVAPLSL